MADSSFVISRADGDLVIYRAPASSPGKEASSLEEKQNRDYEAWVQEGALDLQRIIKKLTGAEPVIKELSASEKPRRGIFIGSAAETVFGKLQKSAPDRQAYRMVANGDRLGLYGESNLATSYAIYDFLAAIGCRWYLPGELGECLPESAQILFPIQDRTSAPATIYRGVWFADDAFRRRNRLRKMEDRIDGAHALENYITEAQRLAHPSWCAVIDGTRKPKRKQLAWGNPEVATAIADTILARLKKKPIYSVSLSPLDQYRFSEGPEDTALDAGVWDETMQTVAVTDRLVNFANRIAATVNREFPDTKFGLLAYLQYAQPPVREKPAASIVPLIAPITYNRFHPILDDRIESNKVLRASIEGWGRLAETAFRGYAFNLAEPLAPFPQIRRYSEDLPYLLKNNVRYWQTETFPSFESNMQGLYLSMRLTWDPELDSREIISDLNQRFYGPAAAAMDQYWTFIDNLWNDNTNLAGAGYGYLDRFPSDVITKARSLLNEASTQATTEPYLARVQLARESYDLFTDFLKMLSQLQNGDLEPLAGEASAYRQKIDSLQAKYPDNYVFGGKFAVRYFDRFWGPVFAAATAISSGENAIVSGPLSNFSMTPGGTDASPDAMLNEMKALPEKKSQPIKVGLENWNQKGFMNYFGTMWYRTTFDLPPRKASPDGALKLWIPLFDDDVRVFINGSPAPVVAEKTGSDAFQARGFAQPATFDVSSLVKDGENTLTIRTARNRVNELGTGGLLAPLYLFEDGSAKSR